jgi:hypothetical protein
MSKNDEMLEYEFVDKFTRNLASGMPIDTSEMLYLLEMKKMERAYIALAAIGAMGITFLFLITFWI